ncbi:uncharacterized protein V1510DRAFT_403074 [Dipodascopsis tothii]|uniref:uncharacterized protein n=1 Tax=Dipodascopsis tothii TaxID=44089 RepID=UPI0034CE301A
MASNNSELVGLIGAGLASPVLVYAVHRFVRSRRHPADIDLEDIFVNYSETSYSAYDARTDYGRLSYFTDRYESPASLSDTSSDSLVSFADAEPVLLDSVLRLDAPRLASLVLAPASAGSSAASTPLSASPGVAETPPTPASLCSPQLAKAQPLIPVDVPALAPPPTAPIAVPAAPATPPVQYAFKPSSLCTKCRHPPVVSPRTEARVPRFMAQTVSSKMRSGELAQ